VYVLQPQFLRISYYDKAQAAIFFSYFHAPYARKVQTCMHVRRTYVTEAVARPWPETAHGASVCADGVGGLRGQAERKCEECWMRWQALAGSGSQRTFVGKSLQQRDAKSALPLPCCAGPWHQFKGACPLARGRLPFGARQLVVPPLYRERSHVAGFPAGEERENRDR
jgi:hypothetical protein